MRLPFSGSIFRWPGGLPAFGLVAASALALGIFCFDTLSSLQFAVAVLYVVVVLIVADCVGSRGVLLAAAACCLLTIASLAITHGIDASETALLRSMVSIAAIAITAFLAMRTISANERLRASERKRANLSRFFSQQMIDELVEIDAPLSVARLQSAVVMFVDMVGFTSFSSRLPPEMAIATLRELLALMSEAVFANHGTIDKFLGDGLLAVFGVPVPGAGDAANAARCALDISQAVRRWNDGRRQNGESEIAVAVGVHFGEVVFGDVGTNARLELTVLGDTVNVASRIEGYSRTVGAEILVSTAFLDRLEAEGHLDMVEEYVDEGWHTLRGASEPIHLHSLARAGFRQARGGPRS